MNHIKKIIFPLVFFLSLFLSAQPKIYYVATNGSDSNTGTKDQPFLTITQAVSVVSTGDTIYVRGGTYSLNTTISISKDGTSNANFYLLAYTGERPILDFSSMPFNSSNRGVTLKGDYWKIRGIDFKGAGDNGMNISGSNNFIEFCSFYENSDTGLQLSGGASNNQIINCDSYYNYNPPSSGDPGGGGNADGFAPKLDVGSGNYFYGCRAWQNSDDGWDGYLRPSDDVTTTLENCWCFKNGYLKDGTASFGNGNGFKLGGGDSSNVHNLSHNFILKNCLAFDNRIKGFDQNNNKGSMTLYNCTAYNNGTNYSISSPLNSGKTLIIKNSLVLGDYGSLGSFAVQEKNSWIISYTVTPADFINTDPTAAYGPRKPDGSLPDIDFLHLASTSSLVDAGVDVGLPFIGAAPDLGAFESPWTNPTSIENISSLPTEFKLEQSFPNPFNPETVISYQLTVDSKVSLKVYDLLGREIVSLVNEYQQAGIHNYQFAILNSQLSSGVYLYRLTAGNFTQTKKLVLLK
ncbi:MAG: hypothetical protein A3J84_10330 [Ignavibacteria bacterium RIFOXYA2_FULL_37_17]|nr:MAG: hypothetical protein A3J84_10330 [Ignavibacteria bacterium RIFOXYA2_FULL_37_17]